MKAGILAIQDNVTERLMDMVSKGRDGRAYMMRVVLPEYRNAQRSRFMTEGESQGAKWLELSPKYAKIKLAKYKAFPGGGKKINIATSRLQKAVTGDSTTDAAYIATGTSFIYTVKVPYAKHVDEVRPIMQFRPEFIQRLKDGYIKWILDR